MTTVSRLSSSRARRSFWLSSLAVLLVGATSLARWRGYLNRAAPLGNRSDQAGSENGTPRCHPKFIRYIPSAWETFWLENADQLFEAGICPSMMHNTSLIDTWLSDIARTWDLRRTLSSSVLAPLRQTSVWSQFEYRDGCTGEMFTQPIEPLVGLLRHPYGLGVCTPKGKEPTVDARHEAGSRAGGKDKHVESKGHQLLLPLTPEQIQRYYPGRKYLFDLGTGTWESGSLPWFTQWFKHRGVEFDEIWAWEVQKLAAKNYWREVPPEQVHKLHFMNLPATFRADDPRNPVNIVRRINKPGDFIAFKLDIDSPRSEARIMEQIRAGEEHMYAEVFYESHFDAPEIAPYFGRTNVSWVDVLHDFSKRRQWGLRLHYWP